jgi:hypothetical protein
MPFILSSKLFEINGMDGIQIRLLLVVDDVAGAFVTLGIS